MDLRLVVGMLCAVVAVLSLIACLLASRNPDPPQWANDFLIGSIIVPLALGALSIGGMLAGEALIVRFASLSLSSILATLGIFATSIFIYMLMGVKKRLAAYEKAANSRKVMNQKENSISSGHNRQSPPQGQAA